MCLPVMVIGMINKGKNIFTGTIILKPMKYLQIDYPINMLM